jgi:AbrB family looped-hinge helix DNA binding protein
MEDVVMKTIRLNSKNQIVLPREARDAMGLKGQDELLVVVKDNLTVIMPKPKSHRAALSGLGKGIYGRSYLKKERSAW